MAAVIACSAMRIRPVHLRCSTRTHCPRSSTGSLRRSRLNLSLLPAEIGLRDGRVLWSGRNLDRSESRLVRLRFRVSHRQGRTRPRCIPNRYGFRRLLLRLQLRAWLRHLLRRRRRTFRVRHRPHTLRRLHRRRDFQCQRRAVNLLGEQNAARSKTKSTARAEAIIASARFYFLSSRKIVAICSKPTASARTSGRAPACCRPALISFSG